MGYHDNISEALNFKGSAEKSVIGVANLRIVNGYIFAFMSNKVIGRLSNIDAKNFLLTVDINNLNCGIFLAPILIVRKLNHFSDRDTYEVRL